jgi:hypothetical protein
MDETRFDGQSCGVDSARSGSISDGFGEGDVCCPEGSIDNALSPDHVCREEGSGVGCYPDGKGCDPSGRVEV